MYLILCSIYECRNASTHGQLLGVAIPSTGEIVKVVIHICSSCAADKFPDSIPLGTLPSNLPH